MAIVLYACDAIIAVDLQLSGLLIFRDVRDRDVDAYVRGIWEQFGSGCELETLMNS